jgi:hypothetical protein
LPILIRRTCNLYFIGLLVSHDCCESQRSEDESLTSSSEGDDFPYCLNEDNRAAIQRTTAAGTTTTIAFPPNPTSINEAWQTEYGEPDGLPLLPIPPLLEHSINSRQISLLHPLKEKTAGNKAAPIRIPVNRSLSTPGRLDGKKPSQIVVQAQHPATNTIHRKQIFKSEKPDSISTLKPSSPTASRNTSPRAKNLFSNIINYSVRGKFPEVSTLRPSGSQKSPQFTPLPANIPESGVVIYKSIVYRDISIEIIPKLFLQQYSMARCITAGSQSNIFLPEDYDNEAYMGEEPRMVSLRFSTLKMTYSHPSIPIC